MSTSTIRRINFYGGSGTGKSTIAADVYVALKKRGYSVELVREVIKLMAYQKRFPKSFKQAKVFMDQLDLEDDLLEHVKYIVTDSPIHMNIAYAQHYGFEGWHDLLGLANKFETKYPSINFWCYRKWPYDPEGRYQTEEQSRQLDEIIRSIAERSIDLRRVFFDDMPFDSIIDRIELEMKR